MSCDCQVIYHSLAPSPPTFKKRKLGKNPDVDTSFLPDRDREVSFSLLYQLIFVSPISYPTLIPPLLTLELAILKYSGLRAIILKSIYFHSLWPNKIVRDNSSTNTVVYSSMHGSPDYY